MMLNRVLRVPVQYDGKTYVQYHINSITTTLQV